MAKPKADNESSDDSNIRRISDDSQTDAETGGPHRRARRVPAEPNGHEDPRQRWIYCILFAFSLLSALAGLGLLLTWVFKYRTVTGLGIDSAGKLANLHPIMMFTFMVSLNMYAVLIYRTHYSSPKQRLKWTHAILAGVNIVMSLLGVFAMIKAHWIQDQPNFYTLHSWIGLLTNALYLAQFASGFVAFLKPGLAQSARAAMMPWHRLAGAFILVLAGLAAVTGITELVIFQDKNDTYSKKTAITYVANFAGISVILMTSISIYLLTAPRYRRPQMGEEEPLKR